jgi:hypothetical protein
MTTIEEPSALPSGDQSETTAIVPVAAPEPNVIAVEAKRLFDTADCDVRKDPQWAALEKLRVENEAMIKEISDFFAAHKNHPELVRATDSGQYPTNRRRVREMERYLPGGKDLPFEVITGSGINWHEKKVKRDALQAANLEIAKQQAQRATHAYREFSVKVEPTFQILHVRRLDAVLAQALEIIQEVMAFKARFDLLEMPSGNVPGLFNAATAIQKVRNDLGPHFEAMGIEPIERYLIGIERPVGPGLPAPV